MGPFSSELLAERTIVLSDLYAPDITPQQEGYYLCILNRSPDVLPPLP